MFSERLRDLRLAKGLTLDAVAGLMNGQVTKQALSKYEHGAALPRPKTLAALAVALGVKASALVAEPVYEIELLQYRTRAPMRVRSKEHFEAALKVKLERRLQLEDRLCMARRPGLPAHPRPVSTLDDVEAAAAKVRALWGLGTAPIANLTDVLETRSIHVFEMDGDADFDGLAAVARDESRDLRAVGIAENPDTAGDRQRFNLAHELGHVAMAPGTELDDEAAASRFAGALLLPAELVKSEVGERRSEISLEELIALKQLWGVSIQCILHRLCELSVITESVYDWWYREIDALGYRIVEPASLPREHSSWEQRNLARAASEGILSREQVAVYAGERKLAAHGDGIDRRALSRLKAADRRVVLREHAERLAASYEGTSDEWLEADLDDPR